MPDGSPGLAQRPDKGAPLDLPTKQPPRWSRCQLPIRVPLALTTETPGGSRSLRTAAGRSARPVGERH